MKNILLLGVSLNSDNKGVNALGIGAISLLIRSYGDVNIEIISIGKRTIKENSFNLDGKTIKIKTYYYTSKDFILSIINKNDDINNIVKRNDLVFDVNEGDSFSDIYGAKRLIRHSIDSYIAIKNNKKLTFLPQTIGPFDTFLGNKLSSYILSRLDKLYVRDDKAIPYLDKLNLAYEKSIDMAVWMDPKKVSFKTPNNAIGINISGLMYSNAYKSLDNKYESYKEFILKLTHKFIDQGKNVVLIPHTFNIETPSFEDDYLAIIEFIKENNLDTNNKITYVDTDYDAQELKYIISKLDFFLGSRMHSCIAALSTNVPTIGLSYSYKFEGTFDMFGAKKLVYNINNLKSSDIESLITKLYNDYSNRNKLKQSLEVKTKSRQKLELI